MDEGKRLSSPRAESSASENAAKRQKQVSGKVCFVCRCWGRDANDFDGFRVFILELSDCANGFIGDLNANISIEYPGGLSICGFDSTIFMVPFGNGREIEPVYFIKLQPPPQSVSTLSSDDLQTLPARMLAPKRAALVAHVPHTRKILVCSRVQTLSSGIGNPTVSLVNKRCGDELIDCEMFDAEANSWIKLPRIYIRFTSYSGRCFLQFFDLQTKSWTEIPGITSWDPIFRIMRHTFIHKCTFLVETDLKVCFSLDLDSPSKGWKLYNRNDITNDKKLYVVESSSSINWCASQIGGSSTFGSFIRFPLSTFDVEDDVKHRHSRLAITLLEGKTDHVCFLNGGVGKNTKFAKMIMDVVNLQAEAVASFRFQLTQKWKRFFPVCMFHYHPSGSQVLEDEIDTN
ncbi:hypothetical protein C2S51_013819 [Perilla frutescens var. frutescens]|nr:hypothetical protein C2S51_013819 [Perilla frutescens var. frutescens]